MPNDKILVRNYEGEYDPATIKWWGKGTDRITDSSGHSLKNEDKRLIQFEDQTRRSYDVRASRFGEGYWKYPPESDIISEATQDPTENTTLIVHQTCSNISSDIVPPVFDSHSSFTVGSCLFLTDSSLMTIVRFWFRHTCGLELY